MYRKLLPLGLVAGLLAGAAHADTPATSNTDLNLRQGPGSGFPIVSVIPRNATVIIEGCLETEPWCLLTHDGAEGWADGHYLAAQRDEDPMAIVATNRAEIGIPPITYDGPPPDMTGVVLERLIVTGPPIEVTEPDPALRAYIDANPVSPVFLEGEVVIGAGLPDTVEVYELPESNLSYVVLNNQPVLVDPAQRQVVYIYR